MFSVPNCLFAQRKLNDLAKAVEEVASELQKQFDSLLNYLRNAAASLADVEPAPESETTTAVASPEKSSTANTFGIPLAQWLHLARSIKAILKVCVVSLLARN
jgi:hypothetical protein